MAQKIKIDPVSRIEGHLKIEVTVDGGVVKEAESSGTLFRGFEIILRGRDPRDAQRITQRVCGVCPTSHAMASTLNLDSAFGIAEDVPDNGRIMRNLILAGNYMQSHILHFFHLAALDYVDVTALADYDGEDPGMASIKAFIDRGELGPFFPRYEGDYRLSKAVNRAAVAAYVQALDMRRVAHEATAIWNTKMPHGSGIVPGGVTETPTADKIEAYHWKMNQLLDFTNSVYIPVLMEVAKAYLDHAGFGGGCGRYVSYGVFEMEPGGADYAGRKRFLNSGVTEAGGSSVQKLDASKITEDVHSSWLDGPDGLHPSSGQTNPAPGKKGGHSWLKSPRYDGKVGEVGPLARIYTNYVAGHAAVKEVVDGALAALGADAGALPSVLGRHAARALEAKLVAEAAAKWVLDLKPGEPVACDAPVPAEAQGMGLTEAPRGALGHWVNVKDGKIANYQLVVPTTWNAGPADASGQPGPIEQALIGSPVKDPENPFEVVRIVRSFDPCLACAVHMLDARGNDLGRYRIA